MTGGPSAELERTEDRPGGVGTGQAADVETHAPRSAASTGAVALVGLVAMAVLVVNPARILHRRQAVLFQPDLWETALAVMGARHLGQFAGAWSRLGLFHPGPSWFYWASPFLAATGNDPSALPLAAAWAVAVCAVGLIVRVGRSTDPTGALITLAVVVLATHQLGTLGLVAPWNPTVTIFPLALALVCVADALWRGSLTSMVVGSLCASYAAQAHLGALTLGGVALVAAVAGGTWRRRRSGAPLSGAQIALLVAAVVLPWVPVVVDQVTGTGNTGKVISYAVTGHVPGHDGSARAESGLNLSKLQAARQLGSIAALSESQTAAWAGIQVPEGTDHRPGVRSDLAFAAMVAGALWAADLRRVRTSSDRGADRLDELGTWCARVGLVALAIALAGALRISGVFRAYTVAAAAGVGMVLWLSIALVVAGRVRARTRSGAEVDLVVTAIAIVVTVLVVLTTSTKLASFPLQAWGDQTVAAIGDQADGRGVAFEVDDERVLGPTMRLAYDLERHGTRVEVTGAFTAHFSDRQRNFDPTHPLHLVLVPEGRDAPADCADLGAYGPVTVCSPG